jgi:FkbM family methyltransferase
MITKRIKIGDKFYEVSSLDNDDYLLTLGDEFDPHMIALFRALIKPDDVVADIGANIGATSLFFSSVVKKVYAFEPSSVTYQILVENLKKNEITSVVAVNIGLGSTPQKQTITMAPTFRAGAFISEKIQPVAGHVTESISIDTLDNYFQGKDLPTFLKVDVEGYEMRVIEGGRRLLETVKPTCVLEMNHFCLDVFHRITVPEFLEFMRSVFPFLYAVDADNKTILDLHDLDAAYFVMHEHVVRHRFPNLVGAYDDQIKAKLEAVRAFTVS